MKKILLLILLAFTISPITLFANDKGNPVDFRLDIKHCSNSSEILFDCKDKNGFLHKRTDTNRGYLLFTNADRLVFKNDSGVDSVTIHTVASKVAHTIVLGGDTLETLKEQQLADDATITIQFTKDFTENDILEITISSASSGEQRLTVMRPKQWKGILSSNIRVTTKDKDGKRIDSTLPLTINYDSANPFAPITIAEPIRLKKGETITSLALNRNNLMYMGWFNGATCDNGTINSISYSGKSNKFDDIAYSSTKMTISTAITDGGKLTIYYCGLNPDASLAHGKIIIPIEKEGGIGVIAMCAIIAGVALCILIFLWIFRKKTDSKIKVPKNLTQSECKEDNKNNGEDSKVKMDEKTDATTEETEKKPEEPQPDQQPIVEKPDTFRPALLAKIKTLKPDLPTELSDEALLEQIKNIVESHKGLEHALSLANMPSQEAVAPATPTVDVYKEALIARLKELNPPLKEVDLTACTPEELLAYIPKQEEKSKEESTYEKELYKFIKDAFALDKKKAKDLLQKSCKKKSEKDIIRPEYAFPIILREIQKSEKHAIEANVSSIVDKIKEWGNLNDAGTLSVDLDNIKHYLTTLVGRMETICRTNIAKTLNLKLEVGETLEQVIQQKIDSLDSQIANVAAEKETITNEVAAIKQSLVANLAFNPEQDIQKQIEATKEQLTTQQLLIDTTAQQLSLDSETLTTEQVVEKLENLKSIKNESEREVNELKDVIEAERTRYVAKHNRYVEQIRQIATTLERSSTQQTYVDVFKKVIGGETVQYSLGYFDYICSLIINDEEKQPSIKEIEKEVSALLKEDLAISSSWVNYINRLYQYSCVKVVAAQMKADGVDLALLHELYASTVRLLAVYGYRLLSARPFIDSYNEALHTNETRIMQIGLYFTDYINHCEEGELYDIFTPSYALFDEEREVETKTKNTVSYKNN